MIQVAWFVKYIIAMFYATDASALTNAFADIGRKTAQFVRTK